MTEGRLPVPAQMALGAALAVVLAGGAVVIGVLGVPMGTAAWIVVFLTIWAAVFITLKLRLIALVVVLMLVELALLVVLAARDFRLWW